MPCGDAACTTRVNTLAGAATLLTDITADDLAEPDTAARHTAARAISGGIFEFFDTDGARQEHFGFQRVA